MANKIERFFCVDGVSSRAPERSFLPTDDAACKSETTTLGDADAEKPPMSSMRGSSLALHAASSEAAILSDRFEGLKGGGKGRALSKNEMNGPLELGPFIWRQERLSPRTQSTWLSGYAELEGMGSETRAGNNGGGI